MDWGVLLPAIGGAGWIGWVIVLVTLFRQGQRDVVRGYQAMVKDLAKQLDDVREQRRQDRDDHVREVGQIHAAHNREFALEQEHRRRCETDLGAVRGELKECWRVIEAIRGTGGHGISDRG